MSFPPSIFRAYHPLPGPSRRADKSVVEEPPFFYATGRCRLCQFSIRDGEFVVTQIGADRFSPAFAFRVNDAVRSNEPRRHRIDRVGSNVVRLFHSSCLKFKHFVITDDLLAVTEHSIGLSEWEERQRLKRIQLLLAPKISHLLSAKVPFEVTTMIASYLVRESAMITAKNQSVFSQASDIKVKLSEDVYASSSVIDGVRYIKNLHNIDMAQGEGYRLVLNANNKGPVYKIRICEDHLGIRFVQFLPPTPGSKKFPEVKGWWRDISPTKFKFSAIRVESDGVKLRRITDASDEEESKFKFPHATWPSPDYPSNKIDLLFYDYRVPQFAVGRNIRMTCFDCNAPDVTGYTMVCQSHWVSIIHAHGQEDDTEFYKEVDACFGDQVHVLIYMPVDQGEYIAEIQRRWMGRTGGDFFDLVFKTNRARQTIFGSDKESLDNLILSPIMKPSQQGSRIYFNKVGPASETAVRFLASDEAFEEPIRNRQPRPGPRTLDPPHINRKNPCFTSRCTLERVKDVTLCKDISLSHRPVIGMLVQYTDGHQECLGEFRFDRALKTIQADQSGGLHIDLHKMEDEESTYVEDVRGFPLGDPSLCPKDESWIEASWSGTLEWKFRWQDCTVTHIPAVQ